MRYLPVVVLTTSETTTSRMFAVLSYTSVTGRYVAAMLAGFREMGRHVESIAKERSALGFMIEYRFESEMWEVKL